MVYQETFLDGLHASASTTHSGMLNSRDFSVTGNIPVQASTEKPVTASGDRDHNQSWAKTPNSFSIVSSNFWFLKRPSTGIPTLFQKECIWGGKYLEERFERKDGLSSPFENNLSRSAGLNGNCTTPSSCEFGKKCAWMHHQTDERSSRSEKWLKFSGNLEYAWQLVKNASGRRAVEVFMEEEHKVLRPIKRAKILKSHTVTEEGPSHGKNWSYRASCVEGMHQNSRCASKEKTWVQSTKKLNENWDAISLVFLSAVLRENFSTLHNFKPYYAFERMELATPTKQG